MFSDETDKEYDHEKDFQNFKCLEKEVTNDDCYLEDQPDHLLENNELFSENTSNYTNLEQSSLEQIIR